MSGTTALLVPVLQARPLIERIGDRGPRWWQPQQQPPHVTILWPFLPPERLDASARDAIRSLAAATATFTARFSAVRAFPGVVYLAPDDPEPFIRLTRAVVDRWPDRPPYAGEFADVVPHVSLRTAPQLPPGVELGDLLPITVPVEELLLAVDVRWRGWRTTDRFPLRTR